MFPVPRARLAPPSLLLTALVAACSGAPAASPGSAGPPSAQASRAPAVGTSIPAAVDDGEVGGEPTSRPARTTLPADRATATPAATPTPAPTVAAVATARAERESFALNLYQRGDFVRQYTFDWCVGASIQMMLNMIRDPKERSRERQGEIWDLARIHSRSRYGGANPVGWTAALTKLGAGDYRLVSVMGYDAALETAARALRETGRPVGLVMWSGRHAWVVNGFRSLGDPARSADFEVTGIRVLDPLYPHGSRKWGPSPKPNSLLTPDELAEQFVPRTGRRQPDYAVPGSYVLVLPVVS